MAEDAWDILYIGGGAGLEGAIRARALGLRAAVVERERFGGSMLHWGCAPAKTLFTSASIFKQAANAEEFAVRLARPVLDYDALLERKERLAQRFEESALERARQAGVTLVQGDASFAEPGCVRVINAQGEALHRAKRIVIATGSRPRRPAEIAPDGVHVLTTDDALQLREVPQSICILGAGPSGCEFASFYAALGSQVTLLERETSLLPHLDLDLGRELGAHFAAQGIDLYTSVSTATAARSAEGVRVEYVSAGQRQAIEAEKLLLATGRAPTTARLGLDKAGVATDGADFIRVDERLATSAPGISAVGDVTGEPMLSHRAVYQAQRAAELEAGLETPPVEPFGIVVDGLPQTASVGMSEGQAREKFGAGVKVRRARLRDVPSAIIRHETAAYLKLVFEPSGALAGAHLMGANAADALALFTLAVRQRLRASSLRAAIPSYAGFPIGQVLTQEDSLL